MPDLSAKTSHEYWREYQDPIIFRVLCWMESVEEAGDENALLKAILQELGKVLDHLGKVKFNQLDKRESFITLANQLNMAQTLRLLQVLDSAQPGSAAQLLMYAETITRKTTDDAGIFLQRNLVFERLRLLPRLFSVERLKLVCSALENDD